MNDRLLKARELVGTAKKTHWERLRTDRNVQGMAFGRRIAHGEITDEPALVIYVARKVAKEYLYPSSLLPRRMSVGGDSLEVDVLETGPFYPQSFTARERPAPSGISIGHVAITAGTLGCLVTDQTDGSLCILSNNHVLANENAAAVGDAIVQPGPADGGTAPADQVARLRRFITINASGNIVDCAIGAVDDQTFVVNQMKNNLMPVPGPDHPAVGLLFAGSCNSTIMNPIDAVLQQLNIQLLGGPGSTVAAEIGMNVEKVGRTTEYTTSTIREIDATVSIGYRFGTATFDHQIVTAWLSAGGDSGSIVCRGGKGGNEDKCGGGVTCATAAAAEHILGASLATEERMAREARDKYLRPTKVGRYLVNLFYANEARFLTRLEERRVAPAAREFARKMYAKYAADAKASFLAPRDRKRRLTDRHLRDARAALAHAHKYMTRSEIAAAERLMKMASGFVGKNVSQVLAILNSEKLLRQLKEIVATVETLEQPQQ